MKLWTSVMDFATDYQEALEQFLICFVCQSRFNSAARKPLALFCGHTFCSSCVPHFKKVFGQLNCPIDHINEVRVPQDIPVNHHVLDTVRKSEIMCLYHPQNPADFYNLDAGEAFCETCKPHFGEVRTGEIRDFNVQELLRTKIRELLSTPGMSQKVGSYPAVAGKVQNVERLLNDEKQKLLFNLQNIGSGLDPNAPRQLPALPVPVVVTPTYYQQLPDGSFEISRFNRILPLLTSLTEETKQWWISPNGKQVDALVVMVSQPITLLGLGLAKEVKPTSLSKIQYVDVIRGTSTQGTIALHDFMNLSYSGPDPQVQTLLFAKPVAIAPGEKVTIKAKQTGKGLFYGDPSQRIEPLIGPNDLIISFDDPTYATADFQNGQNKWAGPIVKLYFSLR